MALNNPKTWFSESTLSELGRTKRDKGITITEADQPSKTGIGIVRPDAEQFSFLKGEPKDDMLWIKYRWSYRNIPIVAAAIDITADQVVQSFHVVGENENIVEETKKFMDDMNLSELYHNIVKQMLVFGNAFIEVVTEDGTGIVDLKILDPITMYVNRDKFGNFGSQAYFQIFSNKPEEAIPFTFEQIAHFKWNTLGESAYGVSMIHPLINTLDAKLSTEANLRVILDRYASPIIHVKVGSDERPAKQQDIDAYSGDLEDIYADTEFVTNHLVEMNMVGAQRAAMDLGPSLKYIEHQVVSGLQVPLSLLGRGEGSNRATAEVQLESFQRRTKSIQRVLKEDTENQIFKAHLQAIHGEEFEDIPEMVWGEPEERQEEANIDVIIKLKGAGVITAQKANELLPEEFHEELPELEPQLPFGQKPMQDKDMAKEPNPDLERIRSGKEKRNPKKVERDGSNQKPV